MNKEVTIQTEVCIPVKVQLHTKIVDDEVVITGGQVVGESHSGDRWVSEHIGEPDFEIIDELTRAKLSEND